MADETAHTIATGDFSMPFKSEGDLSMPNESVGHIPCPSLGTNSFPNVTGDAENLSKAADSWQCDTRTSLADLSTHVDAGNPILDRRSNEFDDDCSPGNALAGDRSPNASSEALPSDPTNKSPILQAKSFDSSIETSLIYDLPIDSELISDPELASEPIPSTGTLSTDSHVFVEPNFVSSDVLSRSLLSEESLTNSTDVDLHETTPPQSMLLDNSLSEPAVCQSRNSSSPLDSPGAGEINDSSHKIHDDNDCMVDVLSESLENEPSEFSSAQQQGNSDAVECLVNLASDFQAPMSTQPSDSCGIASDAVPSVCESGDFSSERGPVNLTPLVEVPHDCSEIESNPGHQFVAGVENVSDSTEDLKLEGSNPNSDCISNENINCGDSHVTSNKGLCEGEENDIAASSDLISSDLLEASPKISAPLPNPIVSSLDELHSQTENDMGNANDSIMCRQHGDSLGERSLFSDNGEGLMITDECAQLTASTSQHATPEVESPGSASDLMENNHGSALIAQVDHCRNEQIHCGVADDFEVIGDAEAVSECPESHLDPLTDHGHLVACAMNNLIPPAPEKSLPPSPDVDYIPFSDENASSESSLAGGGFLLSDSLVTDMKRALRSREVVELVQWRDPRRSAVALVSGMVVLVSMLYFSLISVVCYLCLSALGVALVFRGYRLVTDMLHKTDGSHPFQDLLSVDLSVSEERARHLAERVRGPLNYAVGSVRDLFLVADIVSSFKLAVVMYALTYVGAWFNTMTLVIMVYVAVFTVPKLYQQNREQIDKTLAQLHTKFNDVLAKVKARVPLGVKPTTTEETDKKAL